MRRTSKVQVKVWGEGALFTRPEGKVERVSYPIMTPSAARGILEGIFWKPEFQYRVRSITALQMPNFHSIVRNEISTKATITKSFMKRPVNRYADKMRQIRHTLYLKNVAYIIKAEIHLLPETKDPIEKYESIFNRRVKKGQCFSRPYLGAREFSAHFGPVTGTERKIEWTEDLGSMFFDYRYSKEGSNAIPYFFQATVEKGTLVIPQQLYKEVYRDVYPTLD
ncbi:type I-C CRISPR-associated protein Cas5c [Bacillus niameyensis]|uniref:type I-C CRISPR-associated protein Cas5c n=1 Tax=Bacillus niameyensis TaxID=1522308 RepID=UPI0007853034|nr:type I-C CRISPR-associated protein Cas5c [Bacillus niameyensis]